MVHERRYRVQFEVSQPMMETIFDLLKGEATNFRMVEIQMNGTATELAPQPIPVKRAAPAPAEPFKPTEAAPLPPRAVDVPVHRPHRFPKNSDEWALKTWLILKPVFDKSHPTPLRYDDPRIVQALLKAGHAATTAAPLLSALRRLGKLKRPARGLYMMV